MRSNKWRISDGVWSFVICHWFGNRERGTGNREQGIGNREQGTGNGKQGTGNREQGTGNREQGTGNREQGTGEAGGDEGGFCTNFIINRATEVPKPAPTDSSRSINLNQHSATGCDR
ncbi:MAG: hypothetical protein RIB93_17550 [Coleofasciculus sp. D1-CHI-01]|uniref:hypothetical protein n=1 Tax=Coleofasciculus sp. D1-CHI-01 TaxID=3068482 RepID=UPI0032F40783